PAGLLEAISAHERPLDIDQVETRVELDLEPSGMPGIELDPPVGRPVHNGAVSTRRPAKIDFRRATDPSPRSKRRLIPLAPIVELNGQPAGPSVDLPELPRRIVCRKRSPAHPVLTGHGPSAGEVKLQRRRIVAGQAKRKATPARLSPGL